MHKSVMVAARTSLEEELELRMMPYSENLEVEPYMDEDGHKTTYNPNGQWDYYRVGGRWAGMLAVRDPNVVFYLAPPSYEWLDRDKVTTFLEAPTPDNTEPTWPGFRLGAADAAFKRDVDFDRIGLNRLLTIKQQWAEAQIKRDQYTEHNLEFMTGVRWNETEDEHVARVMNELGFAIVTNSYLDLDGVWHEKPWRIEGSPPFPGHDHPDVEAWREARNLEHLKIDAEWQAEFRAFWDALPDDAFVWVTDCHS